MAAKEIKSTTVNPEDEEETVNQWQSFGWEFKSTQEVRTNDSQVFTKQDDDGTEHFTTTKGVHYIKLTFERDPARQNYAQLKALEGQYYSIEYPYAPPSFGFLWGILVAIGLFLFVVPGILVIVLRAIHCSKRKKLYEEECEVVGKKRQAILAKAQPLV